LVISLDLIHLSIFKNNNKKEYSRIVNRGQSMSGAHHQGRLGEDFQEMLYNVDY